MTEDEILFDQAVEAQEALQLVLDHLSFRKDKEVYLTLIQELVDLQYVIEKDVKGLSYYG